jgi:hypothetical protein
MSEAATHLKRHATILTTFVIIFVLIPYLPRQVLLLVDHILVRLVLVASLIATAYVSPVAAIAHFIVLAFLFIQRNKVKVHTLRRAMQQSDEESPAIANIVTPETAPYQPPFEEPTKEMHDYFPGEEAGDNSFHTVAPTQDTKQPLETETADGSSKAIEQLFEWVNPAPAQAP